jgi:hypothetical protein
MTSVTVLGDKRQLTKYLNLGFDQEPLKLDYGVHDLTNQFLILILSPFKCEFDDVAD